MGGPLWRLPDVAPAGRSHPKVCSGPDDAQDGQLRKSFRNRQMPEIPVPCVCLVIMGWRSAGRPSRHASHQMRSTSVERAPPGGAHKLTSSGELEELFRGPDQARHARPCESFDGGDAKEGRYPPSRPCITRQYRVLKAVLWAFKRETWCLGLSARTLDPHESLNASLWMGDGAEGDSRGLPGVAPSLWLAGTASGCIVLAA